MQKKIKMTLNKFKSSYNHQSSYLKDRIELVSLLSLSSSSKKF